MGWKCFGMIEMLKNDLNVLNMFSNVYITILSNIKYSNNSIIVGLDWIRNIEGFEGI